MLFFNKPRDSYYFSYRDKSGKRRQFSCHTSNKKVAQRYAIRKLQQLNLEEALPAPLSESPLSESPLSESRLTEFADAYLVAKAFSLKPGTTRVIRDSFHQFVKRYGNLPLRDITMSLAEDFITKGQPSAHTSRRHYGHLKSAFRWAVERKLIVDNPFEFPKPKPPVQTAEYLLPAEFEVLFGSIPERSYEERRFKRFVLIAYETGLRLSELLHIERQWIRWDKSLLIVISDEASFRTKSDKSRAVPLSERAKATMHEQLKDTLASGSLSAQNSKYLFPNNGGGTLSPTLFQHRFKAAIRKSLPYKPKLHFHSLRHSFGSRMASAGVPLPELQKAMGHSVISMTEKYVHLEMEVYNFIPGILNQQPSTSKKGTKV